METIYRVGEIHQQILEIKAPLVDILNTVMTPGSSRVDKVRAALKLRRLAKLVNALPEPTRENTHLPNTWQLIEMRDEFFRHENNPGREKALRAIWNGFIILYDYDQYYRDRINWVLEEWAKRPWTGLAPNRPRRAHWRP